MRNYEERQSRGLYRSRRGMVFGVCAGVADYLDVSLFWCRALFVAFTVVTTFWPGILVYFVAALLMKPEPVVPFREDTDREFYESYVNSRTMALRRLKHTFDGLERRIRRMEDVVTARDYDWERRLHRS